MSNYSFDLKLKIVKHYLEGEESYVSLSKRYKVDGASIQAWVYSYRFHGVQGLEGGGKSFDGAFKLNVLNYIREHSMSYREAAAYFNIGCHKTIRKWNDLYQQHGIERLNTNIKGRPPMSKKKENESLEEEVKRLRAENAYLKKLRTLIQERDLSKKKSRSK